MNWLEIIGSLIGLVYLYLEYKASSWLWIVSILMPAIYIIVYYRAGLYADFGINIYYIIAAIYGWCVWTRGKKAPSQTFVPIRHTPTKAYFPLLGIMIILYSVISYILLHCTDSTVPHLDAFTTALSVIGMWLLARKYVEQWLSWIAVDLVSAGLYWYKGLAFTAALYALYTIIAIFGYFKWKKLMSQTI